jgi:hypothetical protein
MAATRRLVLGRVEIAGAREQVAADLGPLPAALDLADFQGDFPYRGFSMRSDGKSFLTSVLAILLWRLLDSAPNPEFEKVVYECAVIQAQTAL